MEQRCAQLTRPTGSPGKPHYEDFLADIGAHPLSSRQAIPTIILTSPTPQSSADPMPTTAFQSPPRTSLLYQTPPSTPPLRTIPRTAEDVQAMLNAMTMGRFDVPVFGMAGVTFHAEEEKVGKGGILTPDAGTIATYTPHKKVRLGEGDVQTQPPRPKRKRATKVVTEDEEEGVQKKPRKPRKKVKAEETQQPT
jgi:hypothetical protein